MATPVKYSVVEIMSGGSGKVMKFRVEDVQVDHGYLILTNAVDLSVPGDQAVPLIGMVLPEGSVFTVR